MKFIRYGKYVGEPAEAVDLEELIKRLGDFFLQSGFESQFYGMNEMDPEKSMEALRQAILRALQVSGYDKTRTARLLGIGKTSIYRKLKAMSGKTRQI